jgi:hypothetical protein
MKRVGGCCFGKSGVQGDRQEQVAAYWLFSSLLVSGVGAIGQSDSFCHDTPIQRWRWGEQAVVSGGRGP